MTDELIKNRPTVKQPRLTNDRKKTESMQDSSYLPAEAHCFCGRPLQTVQNTAFQGIFAGFRHISVADAFQHDGKHRTADPPAPSSCAIIVITFCGGPVFLRASGTCCAKSRICRVSEGISKQNRGCITAPEKFFSLPAVREQSGFAAVLWWRSRN